MISDSDISMACKLPSLKTPSSNFFLADQAGIVRRKALVDSILKKHVNMRMEKGMISCKSSQILMLLIIRWAQGSTVNDYCLTYF